MIRASVMANDSLVVDTVASLLSQELSLDVLQLTYCLPCNMNEYLRDHDTVLIIIDDGEANLAVHPVPLSGWNDGPLLLMQVSLKAIHLDVHQRHQLGDPRMEQVSALVREFSKSYLRKIDETATWAI